MSNDVIRRLVETQYEQDGELLAYNCMVSALFVTLPADARASVMQDFEQQVEAAKAALLGTTTPEKVLQEFDYHVGLLRDLRHQ